MGLVVTMAAIQPLCAFFYFANPNQGYRQKLTILFNYVVTLKLLEVDPCIYLEHPRTVNFEGSGSNHIKQATTTETKQFLGTFSGTART